MGLNPNSEFKGQAQVRIQNLKRETEIREWQRISNSKDVHDFENYKITYPNSAYAALADERVNELVFEPKMVTVQGGTFQMGEVLGDNEAKSEKPVHTVTLSHFQIGKFEVTQAQWQAIMGNNPSEFKGYNLPVENVSWEDTQEYLKKLNAKTGKSYRLPTEAEWEYAAREGGKKVRFGNGKDTANSTEINFNGEKEYKKKYSIEGSYKRKTMPVGSFSANSLGIYDMSGNVQEWCNDWFETYNSGAVNNPKGATTGTYRVHRGGSWYGFPVNCRTTFRGWFTPTYRSHNFGFRITHTLL